MHRLLRRLIERDSFKVFLVAVLGVALFMSKLDGNGIAGTDDAYYAQKAKEILQTNEWMTLYFDGDPRFDNPPLFMWLVALSFRVFGINEFAAKFPSALMGVSCLVLLFFFARYLVNSRFALISAVILGLSPTFVKYSRHGMIDVSLAFFVVLSFYAFVRAIRGNPRFYLLWGLSVSAGIWLKSVLGGLPVLICGLYILLSRRRDVLRSGYFWCGCAIVLGLGGYWHYWSYWQHGEAFFDEHFGWLLFDQALRSGAGDSWLDHLTYFKAVLTYYWPWLPFFLLGLHYLVRKPEWRRIEPLLLLLWIFVFLTVMTPMGMRKTWYIIFILPAMAMVSATGLYQALSETARQRILVGTVYLVVAISIISTMTPVRLSADREKDIRLLAPYVRHLVASEIPLLLARDHSYGARNALVFYTDKSVRMAILDPLLIDRLFSRPEPAFCVTEIDLVPAVREVYPDVVVVRRGDEFALLANQPVELPQGIEPDR